MNILYSLQHGFTNPATGGQLLAGGGGSRSELFGPRIRGPENDFTNRNTTFLTWNLLYLARMLEHAGGSPARGNQAGVWDAAAGSTPRTPSIGPDP